MLVLAFFMWKKLANYVALMGPNSFLSVPYVFSATTLGEN